MMGWPDRVEGGGVGWPDRVEEDEGNGVVCCLILICFDFNFCFVL